MKPEFDLCVIGAGSGGLSVAAGAARFGARVALIERAEMGGDCLNVGCVPSKALIAAARRAHLMRTAGGFGVAPVEPQVDWAAVRAHIKGVIASIAPHDSQERFEGLGVTVIRAEGRFVGPDAVEAGGRRVTARRFVIATGSRPAVPALPGLERTPFLTNETIFDAPDFPRRLLIIGGGPIGLEMAQAFRRLGAETTVFEAGRALAKDDPELAVLALAALRREGVALHEGAKIRAAEPAAGDVRLLLEGGAAFEGTHLLVAAGRRPNVESLNLEAAGVAATAQGVGVDSGLKTSNRRVYAIGDIVAGGARFTHAAGAQAGLVLRNALFRLPVKWRPEFVPWCSYIDPELAQAGLTEAAARLIHGDRVSVARWSFAENDRARAEDAHAGLVKAVVGPRGRILGCSIFGPHAGELIAPWALAVSSGMKMSAMAGATLPYPTLAEASKRAAGAWFEPQIFGPWPRRIASWLAKLP